VLERKLKQKNVRENGLCLYKNEFVQASLFPVIFHNKKQKVADSSRLFKSERCIILDQACVP
jgi:hypothetical protein